MRVDLPVARLARGRDIPAVCVPHVRKAVTHQPVTFYAPPPWLFLAFMAIPLATAFTLHAWGANKAVGTLGFCVAAAPALFFSRNWPQLTIKNWPVCDRCQQQGRWLTTRHEIGWAMFAVFAVISIIAPSAGGWGPLVVTLPLALVGLVLTAGRRPLSRYNRSAATYVGGGASGYLTRDGKTLRLIRVSPAFVEAIRHQQRGEPLPS
jgi:hypothetical protein